MSADEKASLRQWAGAWRRAMTPAARADAGRRIADRVVAMDEFTSARAVGCYLAQPDEVATDGVMDAAWSSGKQVCVPAYRADRGDYGLCRLSRETTRVAGRWGIEEPADPRWLDAALGLLVVPGLAFDAAGGRVGHGGGYYDRLSGQEWVRDAARVGVAFDWQVVERVPMCAHDVRMDAVVTEARVIRIGG